MLRSFETLRNGMNSITDYNDVLAHNMSNVNSTGFKQSKVIFQSFNDIMLRKISDNVSDYNSQNNLIGKINTGSRVESIVVDFNQGSIKPTGNPLDLAINGNGFFEIQTENGKAYTRNGSFMITSDGTLVTTNGDMVMGDNGKIQINPRKDEKDSIIIDSAGKISIGKRKVGQLKMVDFNDKINLASVGNALFKPTNPDQNKPVIAENFKITQGALEGSNSNTIELMMNSINASRTYESMNNVIRQSSQAVQKTINQVGRAR